MLFDYNYVQKFNLTTNTWTYITYTSFSVYKTACISLPSEEVLFIGSIFLGGKIAYLFNPTTNVFRRISDSNYDQTNANLVQLGQRIFAIGGYGYVAEEFSYNNNGNNGTWTELSNSWMVSRYYSLGVAAVPAAYFYDYLGGCQGSN